MKELLNQYFEFATDLLLSLGIYWGEIKDVIIMPKASTTILGNCHRNNYHGYIPILSL